MSLDAPVSFPPLSLLFLDLFTVPVSSYPLLLLLLLYYLLSSFQVIHFLQPAGSDVVLLFIIYFTSFFSGLFLGFLILPLPLFSFPSFLFILFFLFSSSPCQSSLVLFIHFPFSPFLHYPLLSYPFLLISSSTSHPFVFLSCPLHRLLFSLYSSHPSVPAEEQSVSRLFLCAWSNHVAARFL